jgi:ABC-type amino acid transport substrate-binding protein
MKKKLFCLLMVAIMVVSIVGCSKTEDDSKDVAEVSTEETQSGVTTIKVGTGNSAPPYCYLDSNGESIGYDIAVLKEMDSRLEEYEFEIEAMDFTTVMVSIDSGAVDVVSHQLVKSDARKAKYLFPEQYYCLSPMALVVKTDSGIATIEDMAGKTISINPTSYEYSLLVAYNEAHPGEEMIINAVSDLTTADLFKQVSNGQIDAALTYLGTYENVQNELNLDNLMLTDVAMVEDTYIMVAKGKEDIRDVINSTIEEMKEDGTLSKIAIEYLGQDVFEDYKDMVSITMD